MTHWEYLIVELPSLEDVERFFKGMNSELDLRPIRHRLADRLRAHVLLPSLSRLAAT